MSAQFLGQRWDGQQARDQKNQSAHACPLKLPLLALASSRLAGFFSATIGTIDGRLNALQLMIIKMTDTTNEGERAMKVMLSAFALAILVAAGAAFVLNSEFQVTADARYVGSGAVLRYNEAGSNLVGQDWSGLNRAPQKM